MAGVSQNFRPMAAADKLTLSTKAPLYPRTDILGNVYIMPGFSLQNFTNVNAVINDAPFVSTASNPVVYPSYDVADTSFGELQADLNMHYEENIPFPDLIIPVGFSCKVFFTAAMSKGSDTPPKSEFKLVTILPSGFPTFLHNFYPAYLLVLPPLTFDPDLIFFGAMQLTSLTNFIDDIAFESERGDNNP